MKLGEQDREKWIALLGGVKFFDGLGEDDLARLLDAGSVKHYGFHEYIFKENDVDLSFFVILKGAVKLIKLGPLNKKREVGKLSAGDCFGEMGLLLKNPRSASVLAAEECFIFKINMEDIETMPPATQAGLYKRFATFLAQRLRQATESIVNPGF